MSTEVQPEVLVEAAPMDERTTVAGMMQKYLPEVSAFTGHEAQGDGRWRYPAVDLYWYEKERHAFLFRFGRRTIGFALVRQVPGGTMMTEFYIHPDFRRQGHGTGAALQVFETFPGKWAVRQTIDHASAQAFFRKVIAKADAKFGERIEVAGSGVSYATQRFIIPTP